MGVLQLRSKRVVNTKRKKQKKTKLHERFVKHTTKENRSSNDKSHIDEDDEPEQRLMTLSSLVRQQHHPQQKRQKSRNDPERMSRSLLTY